MARTKSAVEAIETTTAEATEKTKATEAIENECRQFVYVGPHIRTYGLMSNMTYIGNRAEVEEHLKTTIEAVPAVKELLVPITELSFRQKLLKDRNNSFYNIYKSVKELFL